MIHQKLIQGLKGLSAVCAACLAVAAHAAPGQTDFAQGKAQVEVASPPQILPVEDLRFGQILAPPVAGTVTITPAGSVTSSFALPAWPSVRGPAQFLVLGDANRRFITSHSNSTVISNANGASMTVSNLAFNRSSASPINRLDANGFFILYIGGTLNVQANQQPGDYSGVFEVTVFYL